MKEVRLNPVNNCYVIFSEDRAYRPSYYKFQNQILKNSVCPFCAGNEDMTPPAVLTIDRDDGSGWSVRVVPNKYPALDPNGQINYNNEGMKYSLSGTGGHEVVIETSRHETSITGLDIEEIEQVINAYTVRYTLLAEDRNQVYGMIFKNSGPFAGTSVEHTHTQLLALPVMPGEAAREIFNASIHFEKTGNCIFCEMISIELKDDSRIVAGNENFIAFCPYASRFPFEVWIIPMDHNSHFEMMRETKRSDLAEILKTTLSRLEMEIKDCSYNYYIHTMPFRTEKSGSYHWHIEITPRTAFVGGFELGTDMYINHIYPENAADKLRNNI
ncbi:galactose-1-phosphate uridylyltransferase [candidate division KSB1 bacterium]